MANFCEKCGAPLEGVFCGTCGARVGEAQAAPSVSNMQAAAPAAAPAKGSNTVLKVVLAVFGVLVLLGILAGFGLYWAANKVKNKVQEVAEMTGVDLEKLGRQGSGSSSSQGGDGCWLLPREEAERLTGLTIVRAAPNPEPHSGQITCQYFVDAGELRSAAQAQADEAMKALRQSDEAGKEADQQQIEKLTKGLMSGAAGLESGKGAAFEFSVQRGSGKDGWAGVTIANRAAGGMMQSVPGLGDNALMAPMASALFVLKGDDFLELIVAGLPGGREKGVEIARAILGRL